MIQDIAPHTYSNAYVIREAKTNDVALCYRDKKVALVKQGNEYDLPTFSQLGISPDEAFHIIRIDERDCFLADAPETLPDGFVYVPLMDLREVEPKEVAFGAITGAQLNRWYKTRQYCGKCGTHMKHSDIERAMVCPECGLIEYPKICPAVIVAVRNGDKLLLTRYANRPLKHHALIAGFVEIGETPETTVHREVMEEVGLKVKNVHYYKSQPWSFTDTLLIGYYCDLDGDPSITLDHNELCEGVWMDRNEIECRANEASLTAEMVEMFRLGKDK